VSIVMGLDQHRAQIAAEWIETITGEISRERIIPADRAGVRRFLAPFRGEGLEVALEATTGWRFVVEELERVRAEVHLAEPTEAAALKGKKKRPKTDWADARHLRELLLIGRLPESWIPPAHILDLRVHHLSGRAGAALEGQTALSSFREPTLISARSSRVSLCAELETVSVPIPAGRRRTVAETSFPRLAGLSSARAT
jgi:hypothetical protein